MGVKNCWNPSCVRSSGTRFGFTRKSSIKSSSLRVTALPRTNFFTTEDVISTGSAYSIKEFIDLSSKYLGFKTRWIGKGLNQKLINISNNKPIIKINPKFFRPAEVDLLIGDSSKAQKILKWKAKTSLKQLVKIMIDDEIKYLN